MRYLAKKLPPELAAKQLDAKHIHLWWLHRQPAQKREPLKKLLAAYCGMSASAIHFTENKYGRPYLKADTSIHFNWSHTRQQAVVSIARHLPAMGIDIEYENTRRHMLDIAKRFFSETEYQYLKTLSSEKKLTEKFTILWTAKEALLKALGQGLNYGLNKAVIAINKQEDPFLASLDGSQQAALGWHLYHNNFSDTGHISLAWRGEPRYIQHYAYPDT